MIFDAHFDAHGRPIELEPDLGDPPAGNFAEALARERSPEHRLRRAKAREALRFWFGDSNVEQGNATRRVEDGG